MAFENEELNNLDKEIKEIKSQLASLGKNAENAQAREELQQLLSTKTKEFKEMKEAESSTVWAIARDRQNAAHPKDSPITSYEKSTIAKARASNKFVAKQMRNTALTVGGIALGVAGCVLVPWLTIPAAILAGTSAGVGVANYKKLWPLSSLFNQNNIEWKMDRVEAKYMKQLRLYERRMARIPDKQSERAQQVQQKLEKHTTQFENAMEKQMAKISAKQERLAGTMGEGRKAEGWTNRARQATADTLDTYLGTNLHKKADKTMDYYVDLGQRIMTSYDVAKQVRKDQLKDVESNSENMKTNEQMRANAEIATNNRTYLQLCENSANLGDSNFHHNAEAIKDFVAQPVKDKLSNLAKSFGDATKSTSRAKKPRTVEQDLEVNAS